MVSINHTSKSSTQQRALFPKTELSKADHTLIASVLSGWINVDSEAGLVFRHNGELAKGHLNHDGYLRIGLSPTPHSAVTYLTNHEKSSMMILH